LKRGAKKHKNDSTFDPPFEELTDFPESSKTIRPMTPPRVRFAPSPTGFFHIGSARTALFNWLYARHHQGTFVLRIEDTDKERNTDEYLQVIYDSLKWLGMDWDEGPGVGGDFGPYKQSERAHIYKEYLQKLHDAGRTYEKDGAIFFRLEGERYTEYDDYKKEEVEKVRAKPQIIDDLIRGRVERAEDRDFVIVRKNGEPVFHLVNVIDDITMGITHVIRGEDHLSNTSKHAELFHAFGAPLPKFAHIPLILKTKGPGKMSKRDQGALIEEYQQRQYLPEAVVNFLTLLGWNPKDDSEVMALAEIIERFDLDGVQKGNARFDEKKMSFINTEHLRRLPATEFNAMALKQLEKDGVDVSDSGYAEQVLGLCQAKVRSMEDLSGFVGYFFADNYEENAKAAKKAAGSADKLERLAEAKVALEGVEEWTAENIEAAYLKLAADAGQEKPFAWFPVSRFAVSGVGGGPDLMPMLAVMGRDRVISRFQSCLEKHAQ